MQDRYNQKIRIDSRTTKEMLLLPRQIGNVLGMEGRPLAEGGLEAQTIQTLLNIEMCVEAAGGSMSLPLMLEVFLKDRDRYTARTRRADRNVFNRAYGRFFAARGMTIKRQNMPSRLLTWQHGSEWDCPDEDVLVAIRAVAAIPKK